MEFDLDRFSGLIWYDIETIGELFKEVRKHAVRQEGNGGAACPAMDEDA